MNGGVHPVYAELHNVRYLEWWSNHALTDYHTDLDLKTFRLRRQFSILDLSQLIRTLTNLTWLSLQNSSYASCLTVEPLVSAIKQLHTLKSLSLELWTDHSKIRLRDLYIVFGRLNSLYITGSWYRYDLDASRESALVPLGMETWQAMRTLRVQRNALPLVYRCPNLTEFELVPEHNRYAYTTTTSLLPLTACPRLEKVKICCHYDGGVLNDFAKTLSALKGLKELVFPVLSLDDIEFLRAPPHHQWQQLRQLGQDGGTSSTTGLSDIGGLVVSSSSPLSSSLPSDDTLPNPLLEHLDITRTSYRVGHYEDRQRYHALLHHILSTRRRLKYFRTSDSPFRIHSDFASIGFAGQGRVWSCKDLETLQLTLGPHEDLDTVSRCTLFHALFREIGQMKKLKTLSISGSILQDAKLEILRVLHEEGSKELERLTFSGRYGTWDKDDIEKLVGGMPKLKYLDLRRLMRGQFKKIQAWLRELGRDEIRLHG
ncbi:hypothetical protein BGX31_005759 [Mortierella sp. GBA43]|nr:hypothetical protein BGX31_005759 [Mortierella sp. GBA43]